MFLMAMRFKGRRSGLRRCLPNESNYACRAIAGAAPATNNDLAKSGVATPAFTKPAFAKPALRSGPRVSTLYHTVCQEALR